MYPRHKLDIGVRDLLYALLATLGARSPEGQAERALRAWGAPPGEVLAALSVRSAFDLLLSALRLPPGSEVLLSAVTHPELPRIVRRHGLRPVPVDLELETLAPTAAEVERAAGPAARVLVVAHLFGGHADLAPLEEVTRARGLLLVEDCAQSFSGPQDRGDPHADVSLYSFGPIKTATALGGALVRVRDASLLERMRALQAAWPVQTRRALAGRALKYLLLALVARPPVFGALFRAAGAAGVDLDGILVRAVRGFAPAPGEETTEAGRAAFRERFHRRPSAPLLALLARRLERFDDHRLARRAAVGDRVTRPLPPGVAVGRARPSTHWVVPVLAVEPERLVASLRAAGLDASRGTSSISTVEPPPGRPDLLPSSGRELLEHAVFVPAYPELPEPALRALEEALAADGSEPAPAVAAPEPSPVGAAGS